MFLVVKRYFSMVFLLWLLVDFMVINNITTDTILATDNFNKYFSQAMNGIGPVLFGGQWVRISHNLLGYYIMYF